MSAPAMDLEAVPAASADTIAQPAGAPKPRRRTYNHAIIDGLREALAATQAQLRDTLDALDQCNAENVELRQANKNQADTVRASLDTAEHAVAEGYAAKRALADHAQSSPLVFAVAGLSGIVVWELAWALVRAVLAAVTR